MTTEDEDREAPDLLEYPEDEGPPPPRGLGALGQLASAVVAVLLVLAFFLTAALVWGRLFHSAFPLSSPSGFG
jgi:hypothetical protein